MCIPMWSPSKQLTKPHEGIWDGEMTEFTRSIISTKKSIRVLVIDIKVTRDKGGAQMVVSESRGVSGTQLNI